LRAAVDPDFMQPNLSFDQAPPLSVPFRFFLAAPVFGVLAGVLLAFRAPDVLASRWSMAALALTHLLTAGLMLQAMTGALLQFVPVAAGGNVWRPRLTAALVQVLLVGGVLMLCVGFLQANPVWFHVAVPLFLAGVGFLATVILIALWRSPGTGATLAALRLAVLGLVITILLGSLLAEGLSRGLALPYFALTNLHLGWGLGVWALALLAGVSYYVVPMFQLTRAYPRWLSRTLVPGLFLIAAGWSFALWLLLTVAVWQSLLLLAGILFAVTTLSLQYRRRRRVPDVTLTLFRFAMSTLIVVALLGLVMVWVADASDTPWVTSLFGVLALAGVFVSAITGMLYKIVPFACWLHLQRLALPRIKLPNMNQMIPLRTMTGQARAHIVSVTVICVGVSNPLIAATGGALFALASAWLGWNLLTALRSYARFRDQMRAAGSCHES